MIYSVSSYSFQRLLQSGETNQIELMQLAKTLGFDAIEISELCPHDGDNRLHYAKRLREASEKAGLPIVAYLVGADFINPAKGDTKDEIARICAEVDIAQTLGARKMRHDATAGIAKPGETAKSFDACLPVLANAYRVVTEKASELGIKTMIENHGFFVQDSQRVEKLINEVNHPNFGWLCDIGNFMCADENPVFAAAIAARYAVHVHVKDFHFKSGAEQNPGRGYFKTRGGNYLRGAIVGHGVVPVGQCLGLLMEKGYDDALTIEFEGMEPNIEALEIGLENLKKIVTSIESRL